MDNNKASSVSHESTHTATPATITTSITNKHQYLKHLNKISHKISKPPLSKNRPPPPLPHQGQQSLHQPPVYNVEKSEFRDVVQRLTGSPATERLSNPPPINPPKPQSSRLQRIRPPPLAQVSNLPPPLLNDATVNPSKRQPISPLPPFPAVHAAAESPISAYMRYLQSSNPTFDSDPTRFLGFSPRSPCNFPASQLGFLQFPLSPTFPLLSPTEKGH